MMTLTSILLAACAGGAAPICQVGGPDPDPPALRARRVPGVILHGTIGAGGNYELDVIASAILGGTSTLGGVGTIPGAMIGGLVMASLSTGLQMLNAPPALTYVIKGAVLVFAVLLDVYLKRNDTSN